MSDGDRLEIVIEKLSKQDLILERITSALENLAAQREQVSTLTSRVSWLSKQHDILINPKDGIITDMKNFQVSCPRKVFKWSLTILIPLSVALLGVGIRLLALSPSG